MTNNELDKSRQNPTQENPSMLSSDSSEDNVAMSIVRLDEIMTGIEPSSGSKGVFNIGIEPQALQAIIYRILVEADQPLWIDEIIKVLEEEMTGIQFTREYLLPILTSSSTIRTFSPYALFTFVLTESKRNTKSKEKIKNSKSKLNDNWDKWLKKGGTTSEATPKVKKGERENEVKSLEGNSCQSATEEVAQIREVDPQKKYRGRPIGSSTKSKTEKDKVINAAEELEKVNINNEATEEIIVGNSTTPTTQDMNDLDNPRDKEITPMENNTPQVPSMPANNEEEIEDLSFAGEEINRWTDENGQTFIVRIADPSELTEEEREMLEKYEHDRLTKTPDQIEREKTRAERQKAMGGGTTAFVTSLKTRGSKKTVAIDKKSWGSLFDE